MTGSNGAGDKKRPRKSDSRAVDGAKPSAATDRALAKRSADAAAVVSPAKPRAVVAASDETSKEAVESSDDRDVLYVHSKGESSGAYNVIRQRQNRLEIGEMRELRQGKPIVGEVVKLSPREDNDRLFDVEVLMDGGDQPGRGQGPAKVASTAYRDNWDGIFGGAAEPDPGHGDVLN